MTQGEGNALLFFVVLRISEAMLVLPPSRQPRLCVDGKLQHPSRYDHHSRWWWAVQAALRESLPYLLHQVNPPRTETDMLGPRTGLEQFSSSLSAGMACSEPSSAPAAALHDGLLLADTALPSPVGRLSPKHESNATCTPCADAACSTNREGRVTRLVFDKLPYHSFAGLASSPAAQGSALEASVGFQVQLVEGIMDFRATARQYNDSEHGQGVVVTVVDEQTPQDSKLLLEALLHV